MTPPGAYLTRRRRDLAARRRRDTDHSFDAIAASVGYALRRAFGRVRGRGLAGGTGAGG
ncbi:hypothetical protein ABZ479_39810 [Streptomyces sp. NPDC005722]